MTKIESDIEIVDTGAVEADDFVIARGCDVHKLLVGTDLYYLSDNDVALQIPPAHQPEAPAQTPPAEVPPSEG